MALHGHTAPQRRRIRAARSTAPNKGRTTSAARKNQRQGIRKRSARAAGRGR